MSTGFSIDRFLRTTLPNEFFCAICKQVMNNPVRCINCKFFICLSCSQAACGQFPSDKHIYTEIDIKLRNKIKELDIRCRFYKYGCLKIDKVDNIEKHDSNCEYAKMVCDHLKNNCSSEFHSYNCPHTLTVCPACKKTIKLEERKTHNCVEWLLNLIKLKEKENKTLISENEKLLNERALAQQSHTDFIIEKSNQIKNIDAENEDSKTKIQLLLSRLKEKKNLIEKSIKNRWFEFNEYCDKKFEVCSDKNKEELNSLEKNLNKTLSSYLDSSSKRLFDFNAAVKADCIDLSTVPVDMKEYDQNPLKTVTFIPEGNPNRKIIYK